MRRISTLLVAGLCAGIFSLHTPAQAAAEMSLMRLLIAARPRLRSRSIRVSPTRSLMAI